MAIKKSLDIDKFENKLKSMVLTHHRMSKSISNLRVSQGLKKTKALNESQDNYNKKM